MENVSHLFREAEGTSLAGRYRLHIPPAEFEIIYYEQHTAVAAGGESTNSASGKPGAIQSVA
jgi:hypothetical protein